jgi:Tfp pilus assembly protein PilX
VVEARGVVLATVLAALMLIGLLGYAAGHYSAELFPRTCEESTAGAAPCP